VISAGAQVAIVALAALTLTSLPRLFALLAASLLLMNLTNVVSWTYQYLLPGALFWLGLMAANGAPSSASSRSPSPRPGDVGTFTLGSRHSDRQELQADGDAGAPAIERHARPRWSPR